MTARISFIDRGRRELREDRPGIVIFGGGKCTGAARGPRRRHVLHERLLVKLSSTHGNGCSFQRIRFRPFNWGYRSFILPIDYELDIIAPCGGRFESELFIGTCLFVVRLVNTILCVKVLTQQEDVNEGSINVRFTLFAR